MSDLEEAEEEAMDGINGGRYSFFLFNCGFRRKMGFEMTEVFICREKPKVKIQLEIHQHVLDFYKKCAENPGQLLTAKQIMENILSDGLLEGDKFGKSESDGK